MEKIILVVEDAEDVRRMMVMLLEMAGYTVLEAADGKEAVERTAAEHPDLILMDISMPVMDGLTATKAIRQFDDTPKIPIIALTAFGKDYYNQAIEAGCDDLITKPVDFETLEFILKYHLAFDAPRH